MKPVFNSLGSNYNFDYVWKAFFSFFFAPPEEYLDKLKEVLETKFSGQAYLTYKGRDAIDLALRLIGIAPKDEIITQAFTCYALEEAIKRAGGKVVYCDIDVNPKDVSFEDNQFVAVPFSKWTLNPSVDQLDAILSRKKQIKAVIIQHTLGFPADIKAIYQWCKKNKIILIEDLSQAFGAKDAEGRELGFYGDVVILSFGRDKILDGVSGGACIIKNKLFNQYVEVPQMEALPFSRIAKDMMYPLITFIGRSTYTLKLGKILLYVARRLKFIENPIRTPIKKISSLSPHYAQLVLSQLGKVNFQLKHRRNIAKVYQHLFPVVKTKSSNSFPSYQRFIILAKDPVMAIKRLNKSGIYVSDRWYRKAVDFGKVNKKTVYKDGSCPNAEWLATHIMNLPTHIQITSAQASEINVKLTHIDLWACK